MIIGSTRAERKCNLGELLKRFEICTQQERYAKRTTDLKSKELQNLNALNQEIKKLKALINLFETEGGRNLKFIEMPFDMKE